MKSCSSVSFIMSAVDVKRDARPLSRNANKDAANAIMVGKFGTTGNRRGKYAVFHNFLACSARKLHVVCCKLHKIRVSKHVLWLGGEVR